MARTPMVTRTINTTKAKVLCLNIATSEVITIEVTAPRTYKNDAELMKVVKPIIEKQENIKAVNITSTEVIELLYGMTEQEFIEKAKVLPPRKNNDSDETADDVAPESAN